MSNTAIKVENLGKLYKLGEISTGTIAHDLKRWWALTRGKEDPFAKIGTVNDRTKKGDSNYVWSLKDINFEVKQGEAIGIIGRNGAGKSTLLKLLSKVTSPTTGSIKVKGRIASLLEVGTGFHPELTGRENIFLNGAILGMNKAEIKSKFDEIVDFSGVQRYIDTPVKRYSSGMYVRLAFAVAAHLEPEILIVDEVLAVGDAEFQKKCIGKMKDVSENGGRTILFVSHNMSAIRALCSTGILMSNGSLAFHGSMEDTIHSYLKSNEDKKTKSLADWRNRAGNGAIRFIDFVMKDANGLEKDSFLQGETMIFHIHYKITNTDLNFSGVHFSINIHNQDGELIVVHTSRMIGKVLKDSEIRDSNIAVFEWKYIVVTPGTYSINIDCVNTDEFLDRIEDISEFNVVEDMIYNYQTAPKLGLLAIQGDWKLIAG